MTVIKCKQGETPFTKWVTERLSVKHNNSANLAIIGKTGDGKTYSGLKICENFDKDFTAERIAFSVEDVVKLLDSKVSGLKRGNAILLEETGVSAGSRDALTNTNKTLSYIYQTIRVKGYLLVLTLPNFMMLDKQVRELQHCILEAQGVNYAKKVCKMKPLFLEVNQTTGKMYKKYLRYYDKHNTLKQLRTLNVSLASKQLIKDYEKKKEEYLDNLRMAMEAKLKMKEISKEEKSAYTSQETKKYYEIKIKRDAKETWTSIAKHYGEKVTTIQMFFQRFNTNLA